jgi:hypothetical protein
VIHFSYFAAFLVGYLVGGVFTVVVRAYLDDKD